jgi:hypothetical protein
MEPTGSQEKWTPYNNMATDSELKPTKTSWTEVKALAANRTTEEKRN